MKKIQVFLYVVTALLAGCSYTANYYSRPPEVEEKLRIQNPVVQMKDTSLYVRPTNGVMLPVGASFGLAKRGDLHDKGYYGAEDESKAASNYFIIEFLVDPRTEDVSMKPSAVALHINQQIINPDSYILAEALRRPDRKIELYFWRHDHLCRDRNQSSLGYSAGFNLAGALHKVEKDTQIEFAAGQPLCLALKFPVIRPDPRTATFTLDLSQAVAIAGERRAISPIQFAPFKSVTGGEIM